MEGESTFADLITPKVNNISCLSHAKERAKVMPESTAGFVSEAPKPDTRETPLPIAFEESAIKVMERFNSIVHDELKSRCIKAQLLPVPPVGSTESWLSSTDDGSQTGRVNQQEAPGNLSQRKTL